MSGHTALFAQPLSHVQLDVPSQLFRRLKDHTRSFWLDNNLENRGWSYLGLLDALPSLTFNSSFAQRLRLSANSLLKEGTPPFCGGWIGYLGYPTDADTRVHSFAPMSFNFASRVLAYSHVQRRWWIAGIHPAGLSERDREAAVLLAQQSLLGQFLPSPQNQFTNIPAARIASANFPSGAYLSAVERALEYIAAGDIYQINLAQRFSTAWELSPELLYWRLRQESPAEFGAFLGSAIVGPQRAICSISPEMFLQVRGREVLTRPIKGTRVHGSSHEQTLQARAELEQSPKERAELNMIVDLERNDLGRVCEFQSVRVKSSGDVETFPTLLHRIATIRGKLRQRNRALSLLKATFPGGSVTGAPKIRAMQLIAELEPSPRGPYCGAIGWIGLNGDMEMSIAIRTALYDGAAGSVEYSAGSGIVADSDPQLEYEETLHKAAAFFKATCSRLE